MFIYVVGSEDAYAGDVKVFLSENDAENYVRERTKIDSKDWIIYRKICRESEIVYLVVSQEPYGGGDENILAFGGPFYAEDFMTSRNDSSNFRILKAKVN